jgi:uncharacterized repeat protein (TIGR01451 family)
MSAFRARVRAGSGSRNRVVGLLLACLAFALVLLGTASGAPAPSAVTDVNPVPAPPVAFGGRVDALAVDPVDAQNVYAAGELGGLWHSVDQGLHWTHVDTLPLFRMRDVEFAPTDSSLVIATGDYDGRQTSGGGIWRSTDGGATWSKPATADPGCTTEPSAHGVAIAPTGVPGSIRIWVGTSCGIAFSANSGATWTHVVPTGGGGNQIWDVQARDLGGGTFQVDACGDQSYVRSTTGGATGASYASPGTPVPGTGFGPCHLATAPQDANTVYMTYFSNTTPAGFCQAQLDESTDGGATWEQMGVGDQNCRFPYVVTHPALDGNANNYEVFAGTSVRLVHQTCDSTVAARCAPGNANWTNIGAGGHPDQSDIAFDTAAANGCPILQSNDGGIDRTTIAPASCATTFNWADSNVGNHGWDIRAFGGTVNAATTDLYFGTQDNGLYYTNDGGATYTQPAGADVYDLFADHNAPARVLYRICFGCSWNVAGPGLAGSGAFTLPPGNDVPNAFVATQFGPRSYAFITRDAAPPVNTWTLWVTTNEGGTWTQMGPGPLPGVPSGPLVASGPAATPTFYVQLNNQINRIQGPLNTTATVTLANNGLINPTTFDAEPANPNRLYAYDASQGLMRSINGGASWTLDAAATTLARNGTQFKLGSSIGGLVTSIAFDGNSDAIMVGTATRGLIGSIDNGQTWFNVRGGEILPRARGFFFDERVGTIYVGTRGRGMWRIDIPEADLELTKTDSPDPVTAGTELFYTLTVTNHGPDTASGIVVTDTLPPQVDYVTNTNPLGCTAAAGVVTCPVGELASGASATFVLKVHVKTNAAAAGPTSIKNTASVTASESADPNAANNTDDEFTIVEDLADLEVTKLCKPDTSPSAGQPITCTIFVDNHGPSDARDVVVTDTILAPGSFTIGSITPSQGSCTGPVGVTGGQRFTCSLGDLQAATTSQPGRATITYTVTSAEGQDLNNVATVRSDTPDPDAANNRAVVTLTVTGFADLALTKSGAPDPVVAGTNVTWTLTLSNSGPSTARNVVVRDAVPSGVVVISAIGSGGATCTTGVPGDAFQPATCNFGSLANGAGRTMTIVAKVRSGTKGTLENDARVTSDTLDPNNANDLATSLTTVQVSADLALTFAADTTTTKPSSTIHYKLTVDNLGPSDVDGVVATVTLPPLKSGYYLHDDGGCTLSNVTLTCPIGTFVAGAPTRTIFVDCFVQGSMFPIVASASVGPTATDPVLGNNSARSSVGKK